MNAGARNLRPFSARGWWLRNILARRGHALLHLDRAGQADFALVNDTRDRAPLLMRDAPALHILSCVRAVARLGGAMAEAGVFAGGSARLICEAKGVAPLHLFDVFETLQRAAEPAADGAERQIVDHFGPLHGTRAQVESLLGPYPNVILHPGVFPASAAGLESVAFSFVHLDLDLGESTREALAFFHPRMLAGGILIGDDYNLAEVRAAFEEYFAGRPDVVVVLPWSQVMVVRLPD